MGRAGYVLGRVNREWVAAEGGFRGVPREALSASWWLRVVLASRLSPAAHWLTAPEWQGLFRPLLLGPLDAEAAVASILSRCVRDAACKARFGNPTVTYQTLRKSLEKTPVNVSLPNPTSGELVRLDFTHLHLATVLRLASYSSEQAALLFAPIGDVAPGLIERNWRRTRKRSRHFNQLTQEQRHKLRITLKRLRYTIDVLRDLFDHSDVKVLEKRLKPLQEEVKKQGLWACHLGPNLGVVELTIALPRVFESPKDKVLWDTGHQSYVHKLLTGRQDFSRLKMKGGLSG